MLVKIEFRNGCGVVERMWTSPSDVVRVSEEPEGHTFVTFRNGVTTNQVALEGETAEEFVARINALTAPRHAASATKISDENLADKFAVLTHRAEELLRASKYVIDNPITASVPRGLEGDIKQWLKDCELVQELYNHRKGVK